MEKSTNSCGTISSPSVQAPNVDASTLLHEAEQLRAAVAACLAEQTPLHGASDSLTVFSCLARGLAVDDAKALTESMASSAIPGMEWFTLELDPARFPQLADGGRQTPLRRAVCPETGLLLDETFRKSLAAEWDKCRKTGAMFALVVFEPTHESARCQPHVPSRRSQSSPSLSQIFTGEARAEAVQPAPPTENPAVNAASQGKVYSDAELLTLLTQTVRAHARGCDVPGRMEGQRVALLMPGANALRARAFAERLVLAFCETLRRHSNGLSVRQSLKAGIVGADFDGSNPDGMLQRVFEAIEQAHPGGTRTFRKNDMEAAELHTQVQACEKQFLFFGTEEAQ